MTLEPSQQKQLENWIEEVREHEHVGLKWATILYKIKASGYWLSTHESFAQFCDDEFGYKKTMAYQLVACGEELEKNKQEFEKNPPRSVNEVVTRKKFRNSGIQNLEYVGTEPELNEETKMPARQIKSAPVEMWQPPPPPSEAPVVTTAIPKAVVPVALYNEVHAICNYANRIMNKELTLVHSEGFRHLVTMLKKLEAYLQIDLPGILDQVPVKGKARGTMQEVMAFVVGIGLDKSDAEWFFWKCEGCGWKNDGKPILDWQATCRAWQKARIFPSLKTANGAPPPKPKGWTIDKEIASLKQQGLID